MRSGITSREGGITAVKEGCVWQRPCVTGRRQDPEHIEDFDRRRILAHVGRKAKGVFRGGYLVMGRLGCLSLLASQGSLTGVLSAEGRGLWGDSRRCEIIPLGEENQNH